MAKPRKIYDDSLERVNVKFIDIIDAVDHIKEKIDKEVDIKITFA